MAVDLESVRQRVKDTGMFRRVEDVRALSDALENPGAVLPAAFVVMPSESADANRLSGGHRQKINARVSVAFVLKAQGGSRSDEVEALRSVLKSNLAGFQPDGAEHGLSYVSSSIRGIARGFVWTEVMFSTSYLLSPP
jgi:hypothetical protein